MEQRYQARSGVYRALKRAGMIDPGARRMRDRRFKRWERGGAMELWQIGFYCVGCCWGLMIVLVAVGAMNIAVMAVLAAVILIEKIWRYGRPFAIAVGITLIVLAALALFSPRLLPGLQPTTPMSDQMPAQTPTM